MPTLTEIGSVDEFELLLPPAQSDPLPEADIRRLTLSYLSLPAELAPLPRVDPFSPIYVEGIRHLLGRITGKPPGADDYSRPASRPPTAGPGWQPAMYQSGESRLVGEMLQATGALLKALDVRRGARILEYGASDGQLALALARMGCDVTVIDPDARNLALINFQARQQGVTIQLIQAPLGHAPEDLVFDRVVVVEALQHAIAHFSLLPTFQSLLAPDGQILFSGEPVLDNASPWLQAVPYPWGPRLDALSLRAMHALGCAELAFRRPYFVEMLFRGGFVPRHVPGPRGGAYLAAPHGGRINLATACALDALPGWGAPEGNLRWTTARFVALPLDQITEAPQISLRVANPTPDPRHLRIDVGSTPLETTIGAHEQRDLLIAVPHRPGHLTIDATASPSAARPVGIALERMEYQSAYGA